MSKTPKQEREDSIRQIVKLYEQELSSILAAGDSFDTSRLPQIIQDGIKLATAKSPSFSNISACTTVNFVYMHLLAQLRPRINDITYSNDILGINYYGINISGSGSGKDSTYSTISNACGTAFKLIEQERKDTEEKRARAIALREKRKDNPNATESDIEYNDYSQYIRPLPPLIAEANSTRGGLVANLTEHQNRSYGSTSVIMNEFGRALKANGTVSEILELIGTLYDQGNASTQMFKTAEVREQALVATYPNALLHSSPRIIFGDDAVRTNISMMFSTMLARRTWFSMPTEEESIENNSIPTSIEEIRAIADARRVTISEVSSKIDGHTTEVIRNLLFSEESRIVSFSEEASKLYTDYYEYCAKRAELMEDSSILQIEMNGRTFKLGRLAALWSLMEGRNVISSKIMESAIYFAEYNSRYLETFISLTTSKAFILLGDAFKSGRFKELSLDTAITSGYISRVTSDFKELLDPLNSYLRNIGVVVYDSESRKFLYTQFKMVEVEGEYGVSYTKVDGVPKANRQAFLGSFENYKTGSIKLLENILTNDTIYNLFQFNDGVDKDGNEVIKQRRQDKLFGTTKVLSIDVDDSVIDIEQMHKFLSEFKHVIATTSDNTNKHKFRILLPINIEVDGTNSQLFKCIVKNICEELTIKADPVSFVPAQAMYGYTGAEVYSNAEGYLYDISDIITHCANNVDVGVEIDTKPKTPAARKKEVEDIMANAAKVFDYVINCPRGTGSLSMARAALHMSDKGFNQDQYTQVMNYLNSCWSVPMESTRFQKLVDQFLSKMQG